MFNTNKALETKEYFIEEEDCIIAHGLVDSKSILNNKQKLIDRIQNYQYTFIESQTISMYTDKKINVFYSSDRIFYRLLLDRIFRIEKKTI